MSAAPKGRQYRCSHRGCDQTVWLTADADDDLPRKLRTGCESCGRTRLFWHDGFDPRWERVVSELEVVEA